MTHVRTHTFVTLANPFLVCGLCGHRIARLHDPIRCGCSGERWLTECGHDAAAVSICPTWGPVDGCTCTPTCVERETEAIVDHTGAPIRTIDVGRPAGTTGLPPFLDPVQELVNALRLTVEYVGTDVLPPVKGWSWFDALEKYAPDVAARFLIPTIVRLVELVCPECRQGKCQNCTGEVPFTDPVYGEAMVTCECKSRGHEPDDVSCGDEAEPTYWNRQRTNAVRGTAIVAEAPAFPMYWARVDGLIGHRIDVVQVDLEGVNAGGGLDYLDNRDGSAWRKVTEGRGSSVFGSAHLSIEPGSFVAGS